MSSWCSAYGVDANFWSEKAVGTRVCGWLERTFNEDGPAPETVTHIRAELVKCLDVLIRSGVAQAKQIEERITEMWPEQKTA